MKKSVQIVNEGLLNKYITFKIIRLMLTKWENWESYKLGLINDKGERIKEKKLETSEEKESWDYFHRFVARVKRLFEKFLGKSKLGALFSLSVIFKEMEEKHDVKLDQLNEDEYMEIYKDLEKQLLKE